MFSRRWRENLSSTAATSGEGDPAPPPVDCCWRNSSTTFLAAPSNSC